MLSLPNLKMFLLCSGWFNKYATKMKKLGDLCSNKFFIFHFSLWTEIYVQYKFSKNALFIKTFLFKSFTSILQAYLMTWRPNLGRMFNDSHCLLLIFYLFYQKSLLILYLPRHNFILLCFLFLLLLVSWIMARCLGLVAGGSNVSLHN